MTTSGLDLSELRRHAPVSRPRRHGAGERAGGLPQHLAARKRRPLPDLFVTDQAEARRGGGFRWFFSTCLAAMVGATAIAAVVIGSIDLGGGLRGTALFGVDPMTQAARPAKRPDAPAGGLAWSLAKSDRLQATTDAVSTRYVVHDAVRQRRGNRDYLHHRPFARVVIRLAAVTPDPATPIPPFNPLKLFSDPARQDADGSSGGIATAPEGGDVTVRIVELLGSILPTEDGQELDDQEARELVSRAINVESEKAFIRPSFAPEGLAAAASSTEAPVADKATTLLHKTSFEVDELADEAEGRQERIKIARGETLTRLLIRQGADAYQARDMIEAARSILPEQAAVPGWVVDLTLVNSLSGSGKPEPSRFSVYTPEGAHKVTVERNAAGEFVATATPPKDSAASGREGNRTSLYASAFYGALAQGISADTVQTILKVHAYEADFRRRPRGSDSIELFFDLKEEDKGGDAAFGELLMTSMTVAGATQKFYRYKASDGSIDYYDANGNNSRRFLLRKPVRSEDVRLTSGFGIRFHPLLNQRRLHAGVDWAAPPGTPIIAAGNGTIEELGYKGQFGNYIRIRHANGYQTAYGHMRSFAPSLRAGDKVRQGQTIGFLGSTGLSSGPHLHYEVLVSNRWVDPLSIQVPREKRLTGRQLAAFQRERVHIDDLIRLPPVTVRNVEPRT